jgi:hypothetical protein
MRSMPPTSNGIRKRGPSEGDRYAPPLGAGPGRLLRQFTTQQVLLAMPGVRAAGATTALRFAWPVTQDVMLPEGFRLTPGAAITAAYHSAVTPGYFEAMVVALRRGRLFGDRDAAEATRVVIVDERLARRYDVRSMAAGPRRR